MQNRSKTGHQPSTQGGESVRTIVKQVHDPGLSRRAIELLIDRFHLRRAVGQLALGASDQYATGAKVVGFGAIRGGV